MLVYSVLYFVIYYILHYSKCLNRKLYGGIQDVLVPEMYMKLTTQKVLVMEWVEVLLFP